MTKQMHLPGGVEVHWLLWSFEFRHSNFPASRRVVPASSPRPASEDALECFPSTGKRAVFVDRINGVLAARRMESALPAKELTERDAVKQDELDQEPTHEDLWWLRS
jgi:hypothetical protein